jgi:hypothetical protein
MTEPAIRFLTLDVTLDDDEYERLEEIHATLKRLTRRRKDQVSAFRPEPLQQAEFDITIYLEALLHRVVATTGGTIVSWNSGNVLCSFLAARALFETVAVLHDYNQAIDKALQSRSLNEISSHSYKRTFATRNKEVLSTRPELEATNVLTFINKLSEEFGGSTFRKAYDLMAERCHPNCAGTISMFAHIDPVTGVVTFSNRQNMEWAFRLICAVTGVVTAAELIFNKLDEAVVTVKALQRELQDAEVQRKLRDLIKEASERQVIATRNIQGDEE